EVTAQLEQELLDREARIDDLEGKVAQGFKDEESAAAADIDALMREKAQVESESVRLEQELDDIRQLVVSKDKLLVGVEATVVQLQGELDGYKERLLEAVHTSEAEASNLQTLLEETTEVKLGLEQQLKLKEEEAATLSASVKALEEQLGDMGLLAGGFKACEAE
ncbi:unnamed protein product, partial [Chrysoparadoxa australica]